MEAIVISIHSIKNATIVTDSYFGYNNLKHNYTHKTVKHLAGEYVRIERFTEFKIYTNTIEGFWLWLKRGIKGIYHWVSKKYMALDNFVAKFFY